MRSRSYLFGLLLLIAGFTSNAQAQSVPTPSEWKRYDLGKGNFSVLLPGQPKEDATSESPAVGIPIDSYTYAIGSPEGSFVAQYSVMGEAAEKWSDAAKELFHDGVWTGFSEGFDQQMAQAKVTVKTTLAEKREIKFSGYPGREVTFTLGSFRGTIWSALVGRQAFVAMVLVSEKNVTDLRKFLDSFTITLRPLEPAVTKRPGP